MTWFLDPDSTTLKPGYNEHLGTWIIWSYVLYVYRTQLNNRTKTCNELDKLVQHTAVFILYLIKKQI